MRPCPILQPALAPGGLDGDAFVILTARGSVLLSAPPEYPPRRAGMHFRPALTITPGHEPGLANWLPRAPEERAGPSPSARRAHVLAGAVVLNGLRAEAWRPRACRRQPDSRSRAAAECGHPVADPRQSVTVGIGASDPVVLNLDVEHPVLHRRHRLGGSGVRVLDDVGERLGHDEVRARLDLRREPLGRNVHVNR